MSATAERNVTLHQHTLGSAAAHITELAEQMEYRAVPTAPRCYQLVRQRRKFLSKRTETMTITLVEDRRGTRARVTGDIDELFLQHLGGSDNSPMLSGDSSFPTPTGAPTTPDDSDVTGAAVPSASPTPISSGPRPATPPPAVPRSSRPGTTPNSLIAAVPGASGISAAVPVTHQPDRGTVEERTVVRSNEKAPGVPRPGSDNEAVVLTPDGAKIVLGEVIVGRDPDVTRAHPDAVAIAVADRSVSKTHLTLARSHDQLVVTDLHSTNGSTVEVDGRRIECEPGSPVTVTLGACTIWAGTVRLDVELAP